MTNRPRHRRIVVVGNGIAALTASDALRTEGFDGELTIVGAESHAAYSRPALSKALLKLDADLTAHELPEADHGATELRGIATTGLDPVGHRVTLSDGSDLPYDGLVIASGARARRLTDSPAEFTLRELRDALALRSALAARPRVVIVGGGVLGMEIASGAVAAGCGVTLVATAAPMSKQLGGHLARLIGQAAEERGLAVVRAHRADVVADVDGVRAVADDRRIDADVVISAVGDLPNVEWLAGSDLLRGGILRADSRGRVTPDIVAAGDVVNWRSGAGAWRLPLWTTAIEQAKVAASALLRGDESPELHLQPYFWTEQFDLHIKAIGPLPLAGSPEMLEQNDESDAALLRWPNSDGSFTAVAVNYRIPIPRLRRLTAAAA